MRESTDDRVPSSALGAAASAPLIRGQDPAGEHRSRGLEALTGHDVVELIEAAERGQVRAGERARALADGSVRQVEVSRMQRVGTFILGRPRRLSRDRHANANYTLIWEEPD